MAKQYEDRSEYPSSDYLYAEDLLRNGKYLTVNVTIERVHPPGTLRTASKKMIDRPTLKFVGKQKMLVLNKTNESVLKFIVGDGDISGAAGTSITIEPRDIKFGKDDLVALRIMPPDGVKIRKSVADRLGKPASWQGPPKPAGNKPETEPEKPTVTDQAEDFIEGLTEKFSVASSVKNAEELAEVLRGDSPEALHEAINDSLSARIAELTESEAK